MQGLWPRVLADLKKRVTVSTFRTWLEDTTGKVNGNVLTVGVPNVFVKSMIEEMPLLRVIEDVAVRVAARPLEIKFKVMDDLSGSVAVPSVQLVHLDPTQWGWVPVSNYALRFWQPYLGRSFSLWLTLRGFAYEAERTGWWPSIKSLAEICYRGDRKRVTGRMRKRSRAGIVDMYWSPGALERLEQERVVWYRREPSGRLAEGKYKYQLYIFKVLASLPVLTPDQIGVLSPYLQDKHEKFLRQRAIDLKEWKQLELSTLATSGNG
jgi:hypothetical protein